MYVLDAHDSVWGSSAEQRTPSAQISDNIPLSPAGDSDDERLRLLYVALTRARNELHISTARQSENGKPLLPVGALSGTDLTVEDQETTDLPQLAAALETEWHAPLLTLPKVDQQRLLTPLLEQYRLSATHLNNYLDVTKGGPEFFLLRNLLHLPEAMSPHAVYRFGGSRRAATSLTNICQRKGHYVQSRTACASSKPLCKARSCPTAIVKSSSTAARAA